MKIITSTLPRRNDPHYAADQEFLAKIQEQIAAERAALLADNEQAYPRAIAVGQ